MRPVDPHYVPAASSDRLLALYDPLTRLFGIESAHRLLIEQANIQPGQRVLEIGCGTGNLALLANRLCPAIQSAVVSLSGLSELTGHTLANNKAQPQS